MMNCEKAEGDYKGAGGGGAQAMASEVPEWTRPGVKRLRSIIGGKRTKHPVSRTGTELSNILKTGPKIIYMCIWSIAFFKVTQTV